MLLNRISLRVATAVGTATLVAGGTFAVSAFADSGMDPGQASSAAAPDQAEPNEDFFEETEAHSEDELQQLREQRDEANSAAGAAAEGTAKEKEEEEEEDDSGGDSDIPSGDPKGIAKDMLGEFGWESSEFDCLEPLWEQESSWDPSAENASSGAYGIPQALPGSKMSSVGSDWKTNPATQIEWGLGYIDDRYGSPCEAHSHSESNGWY